jgi:hypothetical protein
MHAEDIFINIQLIGGMNPYVIPHENERYPQLAKIWMHARR